MKSFLHGKAKVGLLLVSVGILCLIVGIYVGSAALVSAQSPGEVKRDATIVVPAQISSNTTTVYVYASGLVPSQQALIKLVGTWKMGGVQVVDPILGGGMANKYGAAKLAIYSFNLVPGAYGVQVPGLYSLVVEQESVAVSAPVEITK